MDNQNNNNNPTTQTQATGSRKPQQQQQQQSSGWGWFGNAISTSMTGIVTGFFGDEDYDEEGLSPRNDDDAPKGQDLREEDSNTPPRSPTSPEAPSVSQTNGIESDFSELADKAFEKFDKGFDSTANFLGDFFNTRFDQLYETASHINLPDSLTKAGGEIATTGADMLESIGRGAFSFFWADERDSPSAARATMNKKLNYFEAASGAVHFQHLERLGFDFIVYLSHAEEKALEDPSAVEPITRVNELFAALSSQDFIPQPQELKFPSDHTFIGDSVEERRKKALIIIQSVQEENTQAINKFKLAVQEADTSDLEQLCNQAFQDRVSVASAILGRYAAYIVKGQFLIATQFSEAETPFANPYDSIVFLHSLCQVYIHDMSVISKIFLDSMKTMKDFVEDSLAKAQEAPQLAESIKNNSLIKFNLESNNIHLEATRNVTYIQNSVKLLLPICKARLIAYFLKEDLTRQPTSSNKNEIPNKKAESEQPKKTESEQPKKTESEQKKTESEQSKKTESEQPKKTESEQPKKTESEKPEMQEPKADPPKDISATSVESKEVTQDQKKE